MGHSSFLDAAAVVAIALAACGDSRNSTTGTGGVSGWVGTPESIEHCKPTRVTYTAAALDADSVISGSTLFVTDSHSGQPGVLALDVSNPTVPTQLGFYDSPANGLAVQGGYLYTIEQPNTPGNTLSVLTYQAGTFAKVGSAAIAEWATSVTPSGFYFSGSYAYVTALDSLSPDANGNLTPGGLIIFDITQPAVPNRIQKIAVAGLNGGALVYGTRLYAWGEQAGTLIFDATSPGAPVLLGTLTGSSFGINVASNTVYDIVAGSLSSFDVTNPSMPRPVAANFIDTQGTGGGVQSVRMAGDRLFVLEASELQVVQIGSGAVPVVRRSYELVQGSLGVEVQVVDHYALVNDSHGIETIDLDQCTPL